MPKKPATPEVTIRNGEQVEVELADQKEFYRLPARFGSVPVDEAPLGWEVETRKRQTKVTKFRHAYPVIYLPFQEVQRQRFGHAQHFPESQLFPVGANRLFFGDCLHVMRQLPSKSIDLIYIDPPFFSGRQYNVIFGDKNEVRSFSDIWEGGMPGYLIWLNARLLEMKRLLKKTGSIYVHLDRHASHYVKVEMDKIFGYDNFINEIVWYRYNRFVGARNQFARKHDVLFWYRKGDSWTYHGQDEQREQPQRRLLRRSHEGAIQNVRDQDGKLVYYEQTTRQVDSVWKIPEVQPASDEYRNYNYPTQKSEKLLTRVIESASSAGDVVADFFCGGGTTPSVAQRLGRRWIACDQSRIAVAITADRIAKTIAGMDLFTPVPDFTVEHWGVYEAPKLELHSEAKFRAFVIEAFGGRPESISDSIHGMRHGIPLWVGDRSRKSRVTKNDVARFAKAVYEERRKNHGVMLAWNFGPDAKRAADILAARENKRIDFVRLALVRVESNEFKQHVTSVHKDYDRLLSFIQPPIVNVRFRRLRELTYEFDVMESVSLNPDGRIANVQWDFNFKGAFKSTQGYTFMRDKKGSPVLVAEYTFPKAGEFTVACSVQDDQGGEKTVTMDIEAK